jgi:uncharacterized membrane protein (DUF4010 family)
MWVTMIVVAVVMVPVATYMIFKSRKIKRRNFFIFTNCLIILETVAGVFSFYDLLKMVRVLATLPTCDLALKNPFNANSCDNLSRLEDIYSSS